MSIAKTASHCREEDRPQGREQGTSGWVKSAGRRPFHLKGKVKKTHFKAKEDAPDVRKGDADMLLIELNDLFDFRHCMRSSDTVNLKVDLDEVPSIEYTHDPASAYGNKRGAVPLQPDDNAEAGSEASAEPLDPLTDGEQSGVGYLASSVYSAIPERCNRSVFPEVGCYSGDIPNEQTLFLLLHDLIQGDVYDE
ncbi:AaceriAAR039Wp [[Ashbya] aceris (nom. inval.)]|nr:AaceriAAR039Wp [[Ashbya] aceris (nom. inval.)]